MKKIRENGSYSNLWRYFDQHSGRINAKTMDELLILDNGINFHNNLDLSSAEDRELKRNAVSRITTAITLINRLSRHLKIDSFKYPHSLRKWFSIDKREDDNIASGKRMTIAERYIKSAERFQEHKELIVEPIQKEEKLLEINKK